MNDKEKQMEEIVDIMLDCDHSFDTCPHSEMGCMRCRAKVILERGYRKIDEGSVVISKEEWEEKVDEFMKQERKITELSIEIGELRLKLKEFGVEL